MQVERIRALADQDSLLCQSNLGSSGSGGVSDEYPLPDGGTLCALDVVDVKYLLRKALVENPRLDLERNLRSLEPVLQPRQCRLRTGSKIYVVGQGEQPGDQEKDRKNAQKIPDANAAGLHGCDLTVGGKAAESDQDTDQDSRRHGQGERSGNSEEKQFSGAGKRSAVAHHEFQNLSQFPSEDNERKNRGAKQGVRGDFAENVPGENAHGANSWSLAWAKEAAHCRNQRSRAATDLHGFARIKNQQQQRSFLGSEWPDIVKNLFVLDF